MHDIQFKFIHVQLVCMKELEWNRTRMNSMQRKGRMSVHDIQRKRRVFATSQFTGGSPGGDDEGWVLQTSRGAQRKKCLLSPLQNTNDEFRQV